LQVSGNMGRDGPENTPANKESQESRAIHGPAPVLKRKAPEREGKKGKTKVGAGASVG